MEPGPAAASEEAAGAGLPVEPSAGAAPGQPLGRAEEPPPEGSPRPAQAVQDAAGAGGKKLPSPRPAPLRLPSLGYGAFRRLGAPGPESPGPGAAELSRDGEASAAELGAGPWAPVELQVDVRVTPVGAAGGSLAPSPAPSRRFLTVPVPESPGFSRRSCPASPLLSPAASPGGTWGRGSSPIAGRAERGDDADGWATPAAGRTDSPAWRCRCRELGLEKDDSHLPLRAETDDLKLPRAVKLIGLPMYLKSLQWALVVMAVLLAVSAVSIVALASRAGARCRGCPQGWMWSEELCIYLSAEPRAWEASQAFCDAHHASLPLLSHTQDMLARFPVTVDSWVGARRGPQGWHWLDGDPLPPQLLPAEDEAQLHLGCGALRAGRLVALDCGSPRAWVCIRGTK
ncbi:killer cell lectin-like receptor subfamily G member 2 [Sorex fumeus]|uniref:killer cell lectin-like receptor subfamily G member 2 n=1 Tax=Sorex fumeus TaxID=62283 RepID=UPI0024ACEC0F|nr:killer cell lectin-like receptor subfamily G member 2 [Sorex fumeus]